MRRKPYAPPIAYGRLMARLIVYDGFIEARSRVWSERLGKNIDEMLRTIELMPGVGSAIVPDSIQEEFGSNVLRAVVSPFEIVYEYDKDADTAFVYDLLYAPSVP